MLTNVQKALKTWRSVVEQLPSLTEDEVLEALHVETTGRNRRSVVSRLVKRATRLSEINASTIYQEYLQHEPQDVSGQGRQDQ